MEAGPQAGVQSFYWTSCPGKRRDSSVRTLRTRWVLRRQERAAIPVIVLGEFRYGIAHSRRRSSYERWLESYLSQFDVLPVTEETAVAYAAVRVSLKRSGRPIPANDAWIAALALQHRLPVLSRDERFDFVPDLDRRGW